MNIFPIAYRPLVLDRSPRKNCTTEANQGATNRDDKFDTSKSGCTTGLSLCRCRGEAGTPQRESMARAMYTTCNTSFNTNRV